MGVLSVLLERENVECLLHSEQRNTPRCPSPMLLPSFFSTEQGFFTPSAPWQAERYRKAGMISLGPAGTFGTNFLGLRCVGL